MSKLYKALIQERADLTKEQKALFSAADASGAELTAEQKARDDAIFARLQELAPEIERQERRREAERNAVALPGDIADIVGEADNPRPFKSLGEQLGAVVKAKLHPHDADPRLEKYNRFMAASGMNESALAEGGAFVQTDFSNTLMERTYATGRVLSAVPDQPISPNANAYSALLIKETSRATGSRYGGLRVYRVGEGGSITASRPEFDRKEIRPYKLAALCYLTDELVQDATALQGHVNRLFPLEASFLMEDELFNGTGVGQSMGVLNATATVSVAKETGQAATTLKYENIVKMWARAWAGSRSNSVWYYNQDAEPQLFQMALAVGTGALEPRFINFAPDGSLRAFGRPMLAVEYCQTLGTVGDIVLADFGQYLGVRKGEMQAASSIHVAFTTDEMALRFVWRYAAEPLWRSALTPKNGTNTLSPFVTLATRS